MTLVPFALEYHCMYWRPSAPLMLISRGVVTERITISAVAPGYCDVTVTVGGEIWGYCEIGSVGMVMRPASSTMKLMTPAKSGRLRKNSIINRPCASGRSFENERSHAARHNSWRFPSSARTVHARPPFDGAYNFHRYAFHVGTKAFGANPRSRVRYA